MFAEPWSHDADGYRWRYLHASSCNEYERHVVTVELLVWHYKDALRRKADVEAEAARANLRSTVARLSAVGRHWYLADGIYKMVMFAIRARAMDAAAEEIVAFRPHLQLNDLQDNSHLTAARLFVAVCQAFLKMPESTGHLLEDRIDQGEGEVREVLRATGTLTMDLAEGRHEILRLRAARRGASRADTPIWVQPGPLPPVARHRPRIGTRRQIRAAAAVVAEARSGREPERLAGLLTEMTHVVSVSTDIGTTVRAAAVLADAALTVAENHDDPYPLFTAADQLSATPGLACLLRAHGYVVAGDIPNAVFQLKVMPCGVV